MTRCSLLFQCASRNKSCTNPPCGTGAAKHQTSFFSTVLLSCMEDRNRLSAGRNIVEGLIFSAKAARIRRASTSTRRRCTAVCRLNRSELKETKEDCDIGNSDQIKYVGIKIRVYEKAKPLEDYTYHFGTSQWRSLRRLLKSAKCSYKIGAKHGDASEIGLEFLR